MNTHIKGALANKLIQINNNEEAILLLINCNFKTIKNYNLTLL